MTLLPSSFCTTSAVACRLFLYTPEVHGTRYHQDAPYMSLGIALHISYLTISTLSIGSSRPISLVVTYVFSINTLCNLAFSPSHNLLLCLNSPSESFSLMIYSVSDNLRSLSLFPPRVILHTHTHTRPKYVSGQGNTPPASPPGIDPGSRDRLRCGWEPREDVGRRSRREGNHRKGREGRARQRRKNPGKGKGGGERAERILKTSRAEEPGQGERNQKTTTAKKPG